MTDANPENEPSMEEILASIRRIISDGEEGEGEGEGQAEAVEATAAEAPSDVFSALPKGEPEPEAEEDILDLTQMVTEQGEVVDLNEAKSARGLSPAVTEPAAASDDDVELTMEGLARALDDVIGEAPAEDQSDDAATLAPAAEPAQPEEDVVLAAAEEAVEVEEALEEPLSPLDALAEIQALAEQQAEMEAAQAQAPEASEMPEPFEAPAPEPLAVEPQALEPQAIESQAIEPQAIEPQAIEPQAIEPQAIEPQAIEPTAAEEAPPLAASPAPEAPLELVDQLGAASAPDEDDDALTEIDQILARAREAAQAQAAKILEDEPEAPPLSPEDQTAALLAGLEQQEQITPGQGIPDDIRTAVEESLGGGGEEADPRGAGRDPFQAVMQAEANMAGAQAQADSGGEEQNLADRKESSHPDYRSRGDESDSGLISSNTAAGAIAALGDLSRAARSSTGGQGGAATALGMNRTLEELVLDAMTPHLKAWLDANLEPLVERIVREEIQRLRRRSEDY